MKNLKTYIEEREELFNEKFVKDGLLHDVNGALEAERVENFNDSTLIGLLEKDIEMWERKKREPFSYEKDNQGWMGGDMAIGYNQVLSDLITERRKLIEELKK